MNWLDSAIEFFSPQNAYKRLSYRAACDELRSYDAGSNDRLNAGWRTTNRTAQQIDKMSRDIVRARSRDLERNSDIAESIIQAFVRNVVGEGFTLQAQVDKNPELNKKIEALFAEWCRPRNCDVTGTQSFAEICQMAERRIRIDGGILFLKCYTDSGVVPFSLQAIEVDELDSGMTMPSNPQNKIVDGIELNEYNKPVAYYIKKYDRYGLWIGGNRRIDAKDVIFLWKKKRPTQAREMSDMSPTITRVRDVNSFLEAVSVRERIAACLAVFIKRENPKNGTIGRGGMSAGTSTNAAYSNKELTPGMITELSQGESIETVNPNSQSSSVSEYVRMQQRLIGSGQGISYEAAARDMSQVNYSSARQGRLEDIRTYEMEQEFFVTHFLSEIYETFLISAVLCGALELKNFWQNKKGFMEHTWIYPGYQWIDPLKEAQADALALSNNLTTLSEIAGARGYDWKALAKQRAIEKQYLKELGIGGGDDIAEG